MRIPNSWLIKIIWKAPSGGSFYKIGNIYKNIFSVFFKPRTFFNLLKSSLSVFYLQTSRQSFATKRLFGNTKCQKLKSERCMKATAIHPGHLLKAVTTKQQACYANILQHDALNTLGWEAELTSTLRIIDQEVCWMEEGQFIFSHLLLVSCFLSWSCLSRVFESNKENSVNFTSKTPHLVARFVIWQKELQ